MPSMDMVQALAAALAPAVVFVVVGVITIRRRRQPRKLPDIAANPTVTTSATH